MGRGICVLIVDGHSGRFCINDDGMSRMVRVVNEPGDASMSPAETQRSFAWRLMSDLYNEVRTRLPGGIVIVAAPAMLQELNHLMIPQIRRLVIAEIAGGTGPEEHPGGHATAARGMVNACPA